jgi:hypothetical protein
MDRGNTAVAQVSIAQQECTDEAAAKVARDDQTFRPVIVAPSYNNARALPDVVRRVAKILLPVIIVNDGSTDETPRVLDDLQERYPSASITVVTHDRNRGKAAALRTAFATARASGFTHAATIDTDGQLEPEEIPNLLAAAQQCPWALVLGRRDYSVTGLPRMRLAGWYTTSLGVWLETGILVRDTQCGLRVYPLRLFDVVRAGASRFGMESEIIARAAWASCPIVEVPVTCHYSPDDGVSHFRPWRDGVHQFLMHAKLTLRRLVPWPHRRLDRTMADVSPLPTRAGGHPVKWPQGFDLARAVDPRVLWGQLRESRLRQLIVAGAVGIGTFMASLPLGVLHTPVGLYAAVRLRVHWLPVLLGTMLAWSPAHEPIRRTAITIGHWVLRWRGPAWHETGAATLDFLPLFTRFPLEWTFGGVVVGFICNWIVIAILMLVFRLIPVREVNGISE